MATRTVKEPEKDSGWKSAQLKIGVIAAILGILTTGYNFIKKDNEKPPVNTELQADLEVSYISMHSDIYSLTRNNNDNIPRNKKNFYLDFSVLTNEISDSTLAKTDKLVKDTSLSESDSYVTCLMIQNKGKGDASAIELDLSRLIINKPLEISEDEGNPKDYDSQIRAAAAATRQVIKLPSRLSTGEGILIPLFISYHDPRYRSNGRQWKIESKVIFLPDNIRFSDPSDTEKKTIKVRKMLNPVRLGEGVEMRG